MSSHHAIQSEPATSPQALIGEEEVATMLGVSRRHITNLRLRRLIRFYRIGRSIRFSPANVNEDLQRMLVQARST